MPRAPKPKDIRQNTERQDLGDVPEGDLEDSLELPRPIVSWLPLTKRSWERYWSSPARHVLVRSLDLDTIERLWTLYDERERAQRELRKPQRDTEGKAMRGTSSRVVKGSQGQMRPSGFYTVIARLDAEIRQLEDRVAKSMKSRLVLGMRVGGDRRDDEPEQPDAGREADEQHDEPPDARVLFMDRRAG